MTPEQLHQRVDDIIAISDDPDAAHAQEDELVRHVIKTFAPEDVVAEMTRLFDADFPRWTA